MWRRRGARFGGRVYKLSLTVARAPWQGTQIRSQPQPRFIPRAVERGAVGPLCSLYVLERLLHAVADPPLLSTILVGLLGGAAAGDAAAAVAPSCADSSNGQAAAGGSVLWQKPPAGVDAMPLPPALLRRLQYSPADYRAALLGMLRGSDVQLASATVRALAALVRNRAVSEDLLELLGEPGGQGGCGHGQREP